MPTVREIEEALFTLAPKAGAMEWDNVGHLVGDPEAPVSRVLVALDITQAVAEEAVAAGCQLIVFTTGRGNAIGSAVAPVMKVTANGDTARKLSDNIDLDMSAVLEEGVSLDAMADITMQQILDTLSGRLTSAVTLKLGYSEAVISRACESC